MIKKIQILLILLLLIISVPQINADDFGPLVFIHGSVTFHVWNESNMSQPIPFDIFITNEEGTKTYQSTGCLYSVSINISMLPYGEKTIFILKSNGYKMRTYYYNIASGYNYTFDLYLPPYKGNLTGSPPNEEQKTKMDIELVANSSLNLTIPMTYIATDITGVYIYNISSSYGTWESVPNSMYTYNSGGPNISINKQLLNDNITMARVDYYYKYESGVVMETPLYVISVVGPEKEYTSPPIEDAKLEFKRYNPYNNSWVNVSVVYTDANGQVDIYLVPHELYKVKISKDDYTTEFSDYIPSSSIYTHTFRIYPTNTISDVHIITDVVSYWVNWTSNESGLFGMYIDAMNRTSWVNFSILNYTDDVVLYYRNHSSMWTFNDSNFTTANHSLPYKWKFVIKHYFWNETITISGILFPEGTGIINVSDLEEYLNVILGRTPFENAETGETVQWTYILIGVVAFIILLSFGSFYAEAGLAGMGVWFATSYFIIPDVNITVLIAGLLVIGIALLASFRGK